MEAWMCCLLNAKYISCRIDPMEEAVLKIPLFVHTCSAVVLTYVWMCAKGCILGAKSRIFMSSAPILTLFVVTYPVGLEEDTRHAWVVRGEGGTPNKVLDLLVSSYPCHS